VNAFPFTVPGIFARMGGNPQPEEVAAGQPTEADGAPAPAERAAGGGAATVNAAPPAEGNQGSGGAGDDGDDADSDEDAAKVKSGFKYDCGAYHAAFKDTPFDQAVTAMFAEYAVLYARIAGQVGESFPPTMTLDIGEEISNQATAWVNNYVTPILGQLNSTKVHKLLRHVLDAIKLHSNLVNGNTASNEALHKDDKPFYLRTNKNPKTFTQQLVRQAVGAKAIMAKLVAERQAWRLPRRRGRRGRAAHRVRGSVCAAAARRAQQAGSSAADMSGAGIAVKRSSHLQRMRIEALAERPGLTNVGELLGVEHADTVTVLKHAFIDAVFECGTVRRQHVRASPDCRGKPWFDRVWYQPTAGVAQYCIGEVRAIVRTASGDQAVVAEMVPVASEPGCPLVERGCTRLQWHRRATETDCAVRVVPLARVRRVIHVVPDFKELADRRGFDAAPAEMDAPIEERLAMHYFLNVFRPWDV